VATGGISRGKFDFVASELAALGVNRVFHEVAQRPGKPLWFGVGRGGVPVFALPGNPVSSMVCLRRYVIPGLGRAGGADPEPVRTAALAAAARAPSRTTWFLPVRISSGPGAAALAEPAAPNTSGDFAAVSDTDGFVELSAGPGTFPAGHVARFWDW
jgi:molybdopterin molybdotransferase